MGERIQVRLTERAEVERARLRLLVVLVELAEGDGVAAELAAHGGVVGGRLRLRGLAGGGGEAVVAVREVAVDELDGAADVLPGRAQRRVVAVERACGRRGHN